MIVRAISRHGAAPVRKSPRNVQAFAGWGELDSITYSLAYHVDNHGLRKLVMSMRAVLRALTAAAWLCAAGAGIACVDSASPLLTSDAKAIEIASGDDQSAVVGNTLAQPLRIRVVDSKGIGLRSQLVTFAVTSGGGSVDAGAVLTTDSGYAAAYWTLGTSTADSQRIVARVVNARTREILRARFRSTATADVPDSVAKTAGDAQQGTMGTTLGDSLVVTVFDRHRNPVPGISVDWRTYPEYGWVGPDPTVTNAAGEARTSWTVGTQAGTLSVVAVAESLEAKPVKFTATVPPGPPVRIDPIYESQTGIPGQLVEYLPGAKVSDAYGNPIAGVPVVFAVTSGGGSITGENQVTSVHGIAVVGSWILGPLPGTNTLTASTPVLTSVAVMTATAAEPRPFMSWSLSAGGSTTCAVVDGRQTNLFCWGSNDHALLGIGSAGGAFPRPNLVYALDTPSQFALEIAVGDSHACTVTRGLMTGGPIYCWGENASGQLGGAFVGDEPLVTVTDSYLLGLHDVVVGTDHSCASSSKGRPYCWGGNGSGQLGNGTTTGSARPVPVSTDRVLWRVGAGDSFTCGLETTTGQVYCWGDNQRGRLGNGTSVSSAIPTAVSGGYNFAALSVGYDFACGVTTSGDAYCWGANTYGTLGDATTTDRLQPVKVSGGLNFKAVDAGYDHACAIETTTNRVWCWGANATGQLGDGTMVDRTVPVAVKSGDKLFRFVTAGRGFTCAIQTSHDYTFCWGRNDFGQLGNGTTTSCPVPTAVVGPLPTSVAIHCRP